MWYGPLRIPYERSLASSDWESEEEEEEFLLVEDEEEDELGWDVAGPFDDKEDSEDEASLFVGVKDAFLLDEDEDDKSGTGSGGFKAEEDSDPEDEDSREVS